MKTEIEAKFLRISKDTVLKALNDSGAREIAPEEVMIRNVFDFSDERLIKADSWVRLRKHNGKVKLAFKKQQSATLHGVKEVEMTVGSYTDAKQFLQAIGLVTAAYQESKRWSWELDGVQIEIDEWPWCPPFVEIEGDSEVAVKDAARRLGFSWNDAQFGNAVTLFRDTYDISKEQFIAQKHISFDSDPPADWQKRT